MKSKSVTPLSVLGFIVVIIISLLLTSCEPVSKISTNLSIRVEVDQYPKVNEQIKVVAKVNSGGIVIINPTGFIKLTSSEDNACHEGWSISPEVSCNFSFSTIGKKTITGKYLGDSVYNSSSASTTIEVFYKPRVSITGTNPDPVIVGDSIEIFISVEGDGPTPTGFVLVDGYHPDLDSCSGYLSAAGTTSCTIPGEAYASPGSKKLEVKYYGDDNYGWESIHYSLEVIEEPVIPPFDPTTTTTIVQTLPAAPLVKDWVTVIVTVTHPDGSVPDGDVYITGADTTCLVILTFGEDRCSVQFNTKGTKTLVATFNPLPGFAETSKDTFVIEVTKPEPTATPID